MKFMSNWHPVSIIVFILSMTVAFSVTIPVLIGTMKGIPWSNEKAAFFARILDSMLTVISVYVGYAMKSKMDKANHQGEE